MNGGRLSPRQFTAKWTTSTLKERSAAQEHFIDVCRLLAERTPAEADPHGEWYCFERGAKKTGGGGGWADVWKRGCFAWEYKGKHKDLDVAFAQLQRYAIALENPPLLIVSDMARIEIHTNFTNSVHEKHVIPIENVGTELNLKLLKWTFTDPEKLRPGRTKTSITEEAAKRFASLAEVLRKRGGEAERVAHFLNRVLFCLFAQDAGLLPNKVVVDLLETGVSRPSVANKMLRALFATMKKGGIFGTHIIEWFNGNLFDSSDAVPLEASDIAELLSVAGLDWSAIEPSIFGTLFERGMDPDKRAQIGAHYTDEQSIMRVVRPAIIDPLSAHWEKARLSIDSLLAEARKNPSRAPVHKAQEKAQLIFEDFLKRLADFRVLDPACGSGNFLYAALQALKDLEHRATVYAEEQGLQVPQTTRVGVQCLRGIELNSYAAELARVTVWIGEIQWMLRHGMQPSKKPILKPLETIECRDAVLNEEGAEATWPCVDAIIGNPPFLGNKRMNSELGTTYAGQLRRTYAGRVPASADLVCYWLEKARAQLIAGHARYAGLVATNSVRHGSNRRVLDRIAEDASIFAAWSDLDWINEGAAVRVSLVAFSLPDQAPPSRYLDGIPVQRIHADLTAGSHNAATVDITRSKRLPENAGITFMGITKVGPFDVEGEMARTWMRDPNPNGRSNDDVLRPSWNGLDLTRRPRDVWIVDFGVSMSQTEATRYAAPFAWVKDNVYPERVKNNREAYRRHWWRHGESRPTLREKLGTLKRAIATPEVAKHRLFCWMPTSVLPDKNLHIITRDDDTTLGILHSRMHEQWSLRLCSWIGKGNDPRYTPTTCFETFPFPDGLTPNIHSSRYSNKHASSIAAAATRLHQLRERWLNPPEWCAPATRGDKRFPVRFIARSDHAERLKQRTLTNLYNDRPTWLEGVHAELDAAVAAAYGWSDYTPAMTDNEIVARLLKLNAARALDLVDQASTHTLTTRENAKATATASVATSEALDRRMGVVCTLINRLADDRHFGRTKLAKLFYLADVTQDLELQTTYYREAAGPLDTSALYNKVTGLEALAVRKHFIRVQQGKRVKYIRGENIVEGLLMARETLGKRRTALNKLIDLFRKLNTEQCEIVATLYACWNDKLLDGADASDESILNEFLNEWHEKKRRFQRTRLTKALQWMKDNGLVPIGRGSHTRTRP